MDKTYRWQNISVANISAAKCTISVANHIGSKHISYKVTGEMKTGFLKPLGSCKRFSKAAGELQLAFLKLDAAILISFSKAA
jgi:hypothetical protein